ncbi:serine/threonine-protein kinase [Nonomuraea sp. LPB2021202275-12-8]|uniref:serine/threonine-protein kinase n=1 Tax=Nonomuraea sp. LPB2021202275-12-8 TaxID=3120159 RepID=UPI00300CBDE2
MYGDGQWGVPGYTEVRELGSGAAGRVVLATRDHDGAEVAVKYLSDELKSDVGFVARFRHEARLLGTMRSPHNARLIDYIETGYGAAIIMELVNGVSLRELLRSQGPTGPEAALTVLKGSLQGLAAAHAIGVVHRDFKPENVIVQGDGASKLVDFGIAVMAGEGTSAAGTPPYMAPEQWSGAPAAPTTDVYAATVVFFECLTGARPFRASNVAALARQHQATPPPVEEVPAPLRGLVERGLAKHASERPPSAEAFLTELEAIAADAYGPEWEERGRRRLAALAGLLLLLFPSPTDAPAEAQTALAETRFREPSKLMSKLSAKAAISTACAGVVIAVAIVLVNTLDEEPALRAQTSAVTPSALAPTTEPPATDLLETDPPEEEPTPTAEEATEPADTTSAAPPIADPATTAPVKSPTVKSPTVKTPKPRATRTRVRTPTPTPTDSPDPVLSGEARADDDRTPSATPTPTQSTQPTTRPTTRPTRPTSTPSETRSETPRPSSDGEPQESESGPAGDSSPEQTRDPSIRPQAATVAPGALLALGLVTSGAVPVTLAVKRRMAGRHRRKR